MFKPLVLWAGQANTVASLVLLELCPSQSFGLAVGAPESPKTKGHPMKIYEAGWQRFPGLELGAQGLSQARNPRLCICC